MNAAMPLVLWKVKASISQKDEEKSIAFNFYLNSLVFTKMEVYLFKGSYGIYCFSLLRP
jgi:hypothetical protein